MSETTEDKKVYLYELTGERFKEIRGTLHINETGNKAVIVYEKDNKIAKNVSPKEGMVYKLNYLWLEKRDKKKAADIFMNKWQKELTKEYEYIDIINERCALLNKYYESRS